VKKKMLMLISGDARAAVRPSGSREACAAEYASFYRDDETTLYAQRVRVDAQRPIIHPASY